MKYIDKHNAESKITAEILHHWRDNYKTPSGKDFETFCKDAEKTDTVWNILPSKGEVISKEILREALYKEQKGICCYCGQGIKLSDNLPIEHFKPKEADKYKNTFNYFNLLLSCDGNKRSGKYYTAEGDTWEIVAIKHEMTVETLKRKNPKEIELLKPKTALSVDMPPAHCDNAKGDNKTEIINPTIEKNCWERFIYSENGEISGIDDLAKESVEVLALYVETLRKKRENAWKGFDKSLEEELNDIIEIQEIDRKQAVELLFQKEIDEDKTSPFCVIKRQILKNIIYQ